MPQSEIITNKDLSIYHLHLLPDQLADDIIFVGDQDRVSQVSKHFDKIEYQVQAREFVTHTGYIGKKRLSVISTGIGTDNIDIVLNEIDLLKNYDFIDHKFNRHLNNDLNIIRIGTSGGIGKLIEVDSFLFSEYAIGLDGLLSFYKHRNDEVEVNILEAFKLKNQAICRSIKPYIAGGDENLKKQFAFDMPNAITLTCTGFYAPQGRTMRFKPMFTNFFEGIEAFQYGKRSINNFEMETAGILGLASVFGFNACSLNAILANRTTGKFSVNPQKTIDKLIVQTLERFEH